MKELVAGRVTGRARVLDLPNSRTSSTASWRTDTRKAIARLPMSLDRMVMVFPVLVGEGERLFNGLGDGTYLALAGTKAFGSGVVFNTYRPAEDGAEGSTGTR